MLGRTRPAHKLPDVAKGNSRRVFRILWYRDLRSVLASFRTVETKKCERYELCRPIMQVRTDLTHEALGSLGRTTSGAFDPLSQYFVLLKGDPRVARPVRSRIHAAGRLSYFHRGQSPKRAPIMASVIRPVTSHVCFSESVRRCRRPSPRS